MSIRAVLPQELEVVVHVAVGDEAIRPAVVVEIRQGAAPADPGHAIARHAANPKFGSASFRPLEWFLELTLELVADGLSW